MTKPIEIIELNPETIKACWDYATVVTSPGYAQRWPGSAKYTTDDADKRPEIWARSKMSEIGFALWAGLTIEAVNLDPERGPDPGYDVKLGNLLVDVKYGESDCLLWPATKRHLLPNKTFHAFVAAMIEFPAVHLHGWCGRIEFIGKCKIAKKGDYFYEGTSYLKHARLHAMRDFPKETP